MLLELQKNIIYGPIQSRRLGSSLGINVLPPCVKVCIFNCLYCQYGWTDFSNIKNANFPAAQKILNAVESALKTLPHLPKYLTFSGNGEPTLHPLFSDIVDGLLRLRDQFAPVSKTAILSNSGTAMIPSVRNALEKLDVRIMKLEAGSRKTFESYDRPIENIYIEAVTEGLSSLKDVTIQALFTKGKLGNFTETNLGEWVKRIKEISPVFIQLYTLDRNSPSKSISKLDKKELKQIQLQLENEDIHSDIF